jgi:hypothetical protein
VSETDSERDREREPERDIAGSKSEGNYRSRKPSLPVILANPLSSLGRDEENKRRYGLMDTVWFQKEYWAVAPIREEKSKA